MYRLDGIAIQRVLLQVYKKQRKEVVGIDAVSSIGLHRTVG